MKGKKRIKTFLRRYFVLKKCYFARSFIYLFREKELSILSKARNNRMDGQVSEPSIAIRNIYKHFGSPCLL